mmetsp:Transcript_9164/g.14128  ORF Transcript_9164/g.14128 Transcript_9164/m.14128 type:complete len:219 (-) Transcript_9164:116-772(-)
MSDNAADDASISSGGGEETKDGKRKERLEQNRISARESRKRKKNMIEELQRTVITLSRENKELNERNDTLRRELVEIGTNNPGVVNIQALMSCTGSTSDAAATAAASAAALPEGIPSGNTSGGAATGGNSNGADNSAAAAPSANPQAAQNQQQVQNAIQQQQQALMQQMFAMNPALMGGMMGMSGMMGGMGLQQPQQQQSDQQQQQQQQAPAPANPPK